MKSFRDYLKEDVVPTAIVQDGSIDLEREVVRAQINSSLASVLADPSVTPYNALVRASKVLSYFSIILPKRVYLDGEKGIEAIELRQFGDRMGMTDQGEFVKEVPGKFYLFIQYWRTHPNVVPYAAAANFISSTGGMFKVAAKVVDKVELDRLIDMAEVSLAESAESRQAMAKAIAPKEDMHTALGDCDCSQGDSPSTKSAVSTMMRKTDKKLAASELEEAMTRKQKVRSFMSHDPEAGERILAMGKKDRKEKNSFDSAKKEIKRLKEAYGVYRKGGSIGEKPSNEPHKTFDSAEEAKSHAKGMNKLLSPGEKKYYRIKYHVKPIKEEKKPKPVNLTPRQQQDKTIPSSVASYAEKIYRARMKQLRAPRTDYSKNVNEDNLDEAMGSVKKTYAMKKMKKKVNTQVKQGLGIGKERTNTVLVTNKGDPAAAGGGGVHRIPRDKYDPKKHNLASE